jgi:3-oxoacyl-[acyl-carrier-protein] synthase II
MRGALDDAGVAPDAIDLVVAHGTATPKNDSTELLALLAVLGERARAVPVVSIKGAVGHTLSAAGMLNVVAAIESLRRAVVPPTCGWSEPDGDRPFDHVSVARPLAMRTALVNAFAFGGQNAVAVIEGRA